MYALLCLNGNNLALLGWNNVGTSQLFQSNLVAGRMKNPAGNKIFNSRPLHQPHQAAVIGIVIPVVWIGRCLTKESSRAEKADGNMCVTAVI